MSSVDADRAARSEAEADAEARAETTVEVKGTGRLYDALPEHRFEYTFEGDTLGDFLDAFLDEFDVEHLLFGEVPEDEVANGWAPQPEELPDDFTANPEGERTRAFARICINGRFNEHLGGFDAELEDGDRVALMYPFMFCC
ncbi:pterin cluster protein [Halobaculum sp. EA56]|uniref:pterin cluster protein n=1 Tax=Halobaculum sp. EA56 TaxID=3421648 RepID=UPI003EBCF50F